MDLFYWKSPVGNFGDALNAWLWDSLLPGWRGWDEGTTLVGVGTILNTVHFPPNRKGRFLVAGTGVGYGAPPPAGGPDWDIRSVRGPRSARALGLDDSMGIIDPAIMLTDFPEYGNIERTARPIFVPHASSIGRHDWDAACAEAGLDHVSPSGDARRIIGQIARAPLVVAEAMHAAIIADAFRVPWVPVAISGTFNEAKWLDWADSLKIPLRTPQLFPEFAVLARALPSRRAAPPPPKPTAPNAATAGPRPVPLRFRARLAGERPFLASRLAARAKAESFLSDDRVIAERKARYREVLDGIIRDYGGH